MNANAHARLAACIAAVNELRTINDDNLPAAAFRNLCRVACHARETDGTPWPAIAAAESVLYAIDPAPGPGTAGEPVAWSHWLRLAWLELVRAAYAAIDADDEDADRWANMNAGELADELGYLADYQG